MRWKRWPGTMVGVVLGVALIASSASALRFGAHDVPTVFYVSKSDDRNRVDYGVRLDARCRPASDQPVFAYWRRFEPGEPRFGRLNELDERAYGIAHQRIASQSEGGTWIELEVEAAPDERILVLVRRTADGCQARARMQLNGRPAWIDHAHVQLVGPMLVDHVAFHGTDVETGRRVRERRSP